MTTTLANHIDVEATPQEAWAVLADLDRLAEYDPVVVRCAVVGDRHEGIGARRRCDARQGRYFIEDVTAWQPGVELQFTIVECNLPTRNLSHTYTIEPIEGGCRVSHVMRYEMRFGPVGRVLDRVMLRRKTDQGIKRFLAGLQATVLADRGRSRP